MTVRLSFRRDPTHFILTERALILRRVISNLHLDHATTPSPLTAKT